MTGTAPLPQKNLYRFGCPHCAAELGVPMEMVDQAGPCPVCWQMVIAPPRDSVRLLGAGNLSPKTLPFKAKRVIPPSDEAPDDSWREVHATRKRQVAWKHKLDRKAQRFLDSSFFFWARIILGVVLVGFVGFTFVFMKTHKWRPWWKPAPSPVVIPADNSHPDDKAPDMIPAPQAWPGRPPATSSFEAEPLIPETK